MNYIEELRKKSEAIMEQRANIRGNHGKLYAALAQRWAQHIGVPIDPATVCLMLADMKIAREIYGAKDEDNVLDLMNYTLLYADVKNSLDK